MLGARDINNYHEEKNKVDIYIFIKEYSILERREYRGIAHKSKLGIIGSLLNFTYTNIGVALYKITNRSKYVLNAMFLLTQYSYSNFFLQYLLSLNLTTLVYIIYVFS